MYPLQYFLQLSIPIVIVTKVLTSAHVIEYFWVDDQLPWLSSVGSSEFVMYWYFECRARGSIIFVTETIKWHCTRNEHRD